MSEESLALGTNVPEVENVAPEVSEPVVQEKMLPQSQVGTLIGSAKREAYEKGRSAALAEQHISNTQNQQSNYNANQQQNQNQSMGGIGQMSPESIQQMIRQESQNMIQQGAWQTSVSTLEQRIEAAKLDNPDIEKELEGLNLRDNPELVMLCNAVDNTVDVMRDLKANPHKIMNLILAARTPGYGHLAVQQIQQVSESLKRNKAAAQTPKANDPLDQVTHSTTGVDSGNMTQDDYRSADWLRA